VPIQNHKQALMGVARAVKQRDPELEQEARRALAAAVLANHIEKVLADAPALSPQQVRTLSGLLRGRSA
jgi:hypothetical protein